MKTLHSIPHEQVPSIFNDAQKMAIIRLIQFGYYRFRPTSHPRQIDISNAPNIWTHTSIDVIYWRDAYIRNFGVSISGLNNRWNNLGPNIILEGVRT